VVVVRTHLVIGPPTRSSGDFMKQLKRTKRPLVLTVNGKVAAVVQDAGAYQQLLDIAAQGAQCLDSETGGSLRVCRKALSGTSRRAICTS
jgi:hypothetical protein